MITMLFFWIKGHLLVLEIISSIISLLLIGWIIYFAIKAQLIKEPTEFFYDILGKKGISRKRAIRGWKQVQRRLEINDEPNLKLAIIEADKILDEILKFGGYGGETMAERLKKINFKQLSNIEEIWQAHKIRNRIVHEPDFHIARGEAWMIIEMYKKAFKELGLID
ncbi:MAG: hypothetical protein US36_C0003G0017 [Candidatus Wolfebacteria bacterium GW2011_GWC1_37_10]|uniref:DUF4145 domain-containing protein n=2 Tax=Candidatus Wolfeibacteriota TaxID=1752735 RepID=A0A0G0FW39_9BACT|nr:MAG: hypothetical protein US36_C0003G0017 [Candidatus Wolfebacteria bacterium GW2011_GWC1_37_10]